MKKIILALSVLHFSNFSNQLLVAEEEKAPQKGQEFKTRVHFTGKEATNV